MYGAVRKSCPGLSKSHTVLGIDWTCFVFSCFVFFGLFQWPGMFCLFIAGREDGPKLELLPAVWPAKALFKSFTELEAAERIKFLVLETRFSSNSSRTHRLILSSSSAIFLSSCLYFPACRTMDFFGPNLPRP